MRVLGTAGEGPASFLIMPESETGGACESIGDVALKRAKMGCLLENRGRVALRSVPAATLCTDAIASYVLQ